MEKATVERMLPNGRIIVRTMEDGRTIPTMNPLMVEIQQGSEVYVNSMREIVKKVTYKADIWRRATSEEVDQIVAKLEEQSMQHQMLFKDVLYLDHLDEQFEMVETIFVELFGEERAMEILAPSVSNAD